MKFLLAAIGRKASLVLIGGVVLGAILPGVGGIVGATLPVLVMLLMATAMVRVDFPQVVSHLRRPLRMGLSLFYLMLAIPLLVHVMASMLELSPFIHTGMVLVACAPPLAASPSMAALLGLDDALVLNLVVVGPLIVPLTAPGLIISILDIPVDLDVGPLLLRLVLTIATALIGALIVRRALGRQRIEANTDVLDGISALILVIFALVVMNGIAFSKMHDPWPVINVLVGVFLVNWGMHALTIIMFMALRALGKTPDAPMSSQDGAIALIAGNRNFVLLLAAVPAETARELLLFVAVATVPDAGCRHACVPPPVSPSVDSARRRPVRTGRAGFSAPCRAGFPDQGLY